jgi:uncharacterized membrane protein YccF (DUF307 family)
MKHAESGRDHHWEATRDQLKAAQHRADFLTLLGLAAIGALLWFNHEAGDLVGNWVLASVALAITVIGLPLWILTRRKRDISAAHLTCRHCGYRPHDTEISEVAESHQCRRCEKQLD